MTLKGVGLMITDARDLFGIAELLISYLHTHAHCLSTLANPHIGARSLVGSIPKYPYP